MQHRSPSLKAAARRIQNQHPNYRRKRTRLRTPPTKKGEENHAADYKRTGPKQSISGRADCRWNVAIPHASRPLRQRVWIHIADACLSAERPEADTGHAGKKIHAKIRKSITPPAAARGRPGGYSAWNRWLNAAEPGIRKPAASRVENSQTSADTRANVPDSPGRIFRNRPPPTGANILQRNFHVSLFSS
jgi:hypothetical protein